jgi:hypothetical protein
MWIYITLMRILENLHPKSHKRNMAKNTLFKAFLEGLGDKDFESHISSSSAHIQSQYHFELPKSWHSNPNKIG